MIAVRNLGLVSPTEDGGYVRTNPAFDAPLGPRDWLNNGPNADRLFEVVEPLLKEAPLARGGFAIKRYGAATDVNAAEVRIAL